MNPFAWSFRVQFGAGALICAALLGFALYVQHRMFMMPCPLCILQRIAFAAMGVFFVLGIAVGGHRWGRRLSSSLVALGAAGGAALAGWHVRMQHLPPDQVPSCSGMDLSYMLDAFPLQKVIDKVFTASGECAKIDWTFLGISMPGWTLVWYVLLGGAALWAGWRARA
jgi:disulfide bond formation protein DsbB